MRLVRRLLIGWMAAWVAAVAAGAIAKLTLKSETDPTADSFALVSVFEGSEFRPTTRRLSASRAMTMFGGTHIDLRRAAAAGTVRLDLTTLLGGTDITVPDSWHVTVEGNPVLGGHEVKVADSASLPDEATHLVISARTVLGGLRVHARPVLTAASTA